MSLFDTFDPYSEELIKVNQQRSFREIEDFPEVIIGAFKEETFQVLERVCPAVMGAFSHRFRRIRYISPGGFDK